MAAVVGLGAAAYVAPIAAANDDGQIFQRRTQQQATPFTREQAEIVARRLYLGILNREPDPSGLNQTITALTRGQLQSRISQMVQSVEFRTQVARKPAREILTQFYQGLLGRDPDESGTGTFLPRIERRQYAEVVGDIVNSPEFRDKLGAATGGTGGVPAADAGAAVNCMEQIVEKVRNDLPGAVLLRFETADSRGVAIDLLDNDRRINYDCAGGATYSYQDNRNTRSAPTETDFPDNSVRACQSSVRAQVGRDRNNVDVAFESAGVMPVPGGRQAVRGLGFEKPQGANFMYQCEMDGTRIVNSSYRMR
jgi:hypothetical protein